MRPTKQQIANYITQSTFRNTPQDFPRLVAAYLISENRTGELDAVLRMVVAERATSGRLEGTVTSAFTLTRSQLAEVKKLVQSWYPHAKSIHLDERIDKTLLGGVKVEMPDQAIDLSVQGRLRVFRTAVSRRRRQ